MPGPVHSYTLPRLLLGTFGVIFGGVGVTVLVFLWAAPFDDPPLFFRIFGSFIALGFVVFGGAMAFSAAKAQLPGVNLPSVPTASQTDPPAPPPASAYACPRCGAPLDKSAEVSPHGDARCAHCSAWFNVHGRAV